MPGFFYLQLIGSCDATRLVIRKFNERPSARRIVADPYLAYLVSLELCIPKAILNNTIACYGRVVNYTTLTQPYLSYDVCFPITVKNTIWNGLES